ncbi:hypothetical protein ACFQX8_16270 [Klenkia terrae]|uniref:hypothetical protein n=1 Tax=Klenkia terrae TaxID=1052259 RepID=UPI003607C35D
MTAADAPTGPAAPARVVVLLSGTGSLCAALLDAGRPSFTVVAVGADREAPGLAGPRERGCRPSCCGWVTTPTGPPGTPRWPTPSPRTSPTGSCAPGS